MTTAVTPANDAIGAALAALAADPSKRIKEKGDDGEESQKRSQEAIAFVRTESELFHDPHRDPYATIVEGSRYRTMPLDDAEFRDWIASGVYEKTNRPLGRAAIDEALMALRGFARDRCDCHPVYVRVGADTDGAIWLDLGDDTGRAVKVTPRGWSIEAEPGVKFRRPSALHPLPAPERGGSVDLLRRHVNVADEDGLVLAVAWLLSALRPGYSHPIATFVGTHGTGKTSASRTLRGLVDPSAAEVRAAPRSEEDLIIAAYNSRVIAIDNLSGMRRELADSLCRVATGGGLSKRKHYSNADEVVLPVLAPIIVNGIDDLNERADLADRMLIIPLRRIDASQRKDEATLRRAFQADAPKILGALLDGVAAALAGVDGVRLAGLPRMADLAKWVTAAEPALGMRPGTFLAAHERQHAASVIASLEASPVATAVRALGKRPTTGAKWEGTPNALLDALKVEASEQAKSGRDWPKAPNKLTGLLRRDAPFLRAVGVHVEVDGHKGRGSDRKRWVTLTFTNDRTDRDLSSPSSPSSPSRESLGNSGAHDRPRTDPVPSPDERDDRRGDDREDGPERSSSPKNRSDYARGDDGDDGDGSSGGTLMREGAA